MNELPGNHFLQEGDTYTYKLKRSEFWNGPVPISIHWVRNAMSPNDIRLQNPDHDLKFWTGGPPPAKSYKSKVAPLPLP